MNNKEIICISCPMGCNLIIEENDNNIIVRGNKCNKGIIYAREEYLSPKRVVTATCKINSKIINRLPVKTDKPINKELIEDLLQDIYKINIDPPVNSQQIIIENYKNLNVNVIATRTVLE